MLFRRRRPEPVAVTERSNPGLPWDAYQRIVLGVGASVTQSGAQSVTVALQHSVIYRCVNKIAGTISTFPIDTRRGRTSVLNPPFIASPSVTMRRTAWVHAAVSSMMLRGNTFGLVDDASMAQAGWPRRVELIDPDRVRWDGARWLLDNNEIEEYPLGPLWHVALHTLPGSPLGLNPLEFARKTTYSGLVAQEFSSNFFAGGGHPTSLVMPETDPGQEGAERLKQKFMQATAGTSREPIVLPQSVKWQQVQISPDDSQFIELMQFDEVALCRFFGLQPSSVGVQGGGSSLTYANREQDKQQELQDAMLPPMIRLEEAMSDLLPGDLAVKFNPAGLLRADLAARYASYEASARVFASTGYWIVTPEEWRDLEDREPLPDASGGSEASEMINAAGGTLPVPAPAELMKGVS